MPLLTTLYELLNTHYYFFKWQDAVEILFFSTLFYYLTQWLKKDTRTNLLPYFYSYCLVAFAAYCINLTTITTFLFLFWPATIMLFMFAHQQTLQRNIVAVKNKAYINTVESTWIETLLRICLIAINQNKHIYCVIEHTDSMQDFIQCPVSISANINKGILELLLESTTFDHTKIIWLRTDGQLVGFNAHWGKQQHNEIADATTWHHETLLYTAKTDALAFHCDPICHSFTIIVGDKIIHKINTNAALKIITQHISKKSETTAAIKPGKNHETHQISRNTK
jgi:hypothetical protein